MGRQSFAARSKPVVRRVGLCYQAVTSQSVTLEMIRSAIIQFNVQRGDVERNLRTVNRRIAASARQGMQLVLLPEMWSTGFANERLKELAETTPRVLEELSRVARKERLAIIGSLPEKKGDKIFNTAYVVDRDGSVPGTYRKVHLFSLTRENRYFEPGRKPVIARTSLGSIGLMICYDLRFPELCRTLMLGGATIIAVMAQWPAERLAHWEVLLKARAVENQLYVLGANRCGRDADLVYAGHSRIMSPYGDVIARAGKRAATISAIIDLRAVERTRKHIPCLKERVPEAYG